MSDALRFLQRWYSSHCDGEWEHSYGITIETLDNPGWSVSIELARTELSERDFARLTTENGRTDWLRCWIEKGVFQIACSPNNLERGLQVFEEWSASVLPLITTESILERLEVIGNSAQSRESGNETAERVFAYLESHKKGNEQKMKKALTLWVQDGANWKLPVAANLQKKLAL